jgi:ribosomal protein S18 acetylase RimI-like enzyme
MSLDYLIRPAGPEGAAALSAIAERAKKHWGYPEHWMALWKDALTITPDFIRQNAVFVIGDSGERVLGFGGIVENGARARLEHLWIRPEHARQGLGRRLVQHALSLARARGYAVLEVESDPNAEAFYLRIGAKRTGETFVTIDGMERRLPLLEFTIDAEAGIH